MPTVASFESPYAGAVGTNDDFFEVDPPSDATGELEPVEGLREPAGGDPPPRSERSGLPWVIVQGVLATLVLALLAIDPYSFTAIEEMVGFALVAFGAFELIQAFRRRGGSADLVQPIAAIVGGALLMVWPGQTVIVAGYFLAGVIVVRGGYDVWAGLRKWHEPGANTWVFVRGLVAIAFGGLMLLFPAQSVTLIVVGGAILIILRAILSIWFAVVNHDALGKVDPADTYAVLTYWLSRREMDAAEAEDVENRVFLNRGSTKDRLWRFGVLMVLATAIATFGLATDSTAVVIGAMLVAPLMTPILGVAAGLINGNSRSTVFSATVTALGAIGAVAVAFVLAALIPDLNAVVQNGQVTSRTSPSLLDLAIAIAAGAAGAYGVSRAESTDALPGVAVAIALPALLFFTVRSFTQVTYWKDSESLYRHAIEVTRNNSLAYLNLGIIHGEKGEFNEAHFYLGEAVRIAPNAVKPRYNLGMSYVNMGDIQGALKQYNTLKRLDKKKAAELLKFIQYLYREKTSP